MRVARLLSIQVGLPSTYGSPESDDPYERPYTTAFFKVPITGPVAVGRMGLEGDWQADRRVHGGLDKAILAYAADHYPLWQEELGGVEMPFGGFGENFTLSGINEQDVCIGDVYRVGNVRLQVSQPRQPCWKLARRWRRKDLPRRVIETGRSGWYLRVLEEGAVEAEMEVRLEDRPYPQWGVERASRIYYAETNPETLLELGSCPLLAGSWRGELLERAAQRSRESES